MEDYGGGGSSLPDDFLGGEAPQLRSLIIQDIGFNWSALRDNPVLRRLSHLHITSTPEDCRAGSECFLTLLARMPSLQTCRLSDCFMNGEDIPSTDSVTDILILPRLSKLALLGPMVAISGILHYLRVQPRAEVSLACTLAGSTGGMLSFFNHRLNDPNRPPCRYLEHRLVGNSFSMQMHANRTLLSAVDPEPLLDVRVMFREHHEAFMGLHNIVPLAEIHEWDLNVSASFGIHMLAAVFSRCENVVQLRLTNVSGIRQVFESYLAPFRSPNEHDKKTAFLPNLRSIRLSGRYPLEGETFWTVVPGVMTERHKLLGILPSITVEDPDGVREYALETLLAMAARVDIATAVDDILQV
ncbi:hypothetical protein PUNSTDRAFT_129157 [Punctularia strigosozonata HHB-11173 SS5]|uniref:uncharacterized protein n=1 Tax=Punctularia strigosozonata (strain HHB-11173) TaxID=741275 RepID=UPI0004417702|nr:uncharacterized protein PUNSTDRAFT_129157 [Punctularia strigosozonata HHB-11173 SS5]EIN13476.1 hypothetical protein PUNSTDRAFT_129157 [Punctularia strigosozonata HHB-11173 SS5]